MMLTACALIRASSLSATQNTEMTLVLMCALAIVLLLPFPRCQNWEGGIGGVPGMEAHGGYTFCGLAALVILKKERSLNLKSLLVSSCCALLSPSPG